jgi:hypothetical protein
MRLVFIAALSCLALACGHGSKIRPTPRSEVAVEAALGGPLFKNAGPTIPLPLTTVGVSYGVADRLDVSAHLHPTVALFGVAGLDVGSSYLAVEQDGAVPAVTVAGRLYGFTDFKTGFSPYLEAGATGSYRIANRFSPFLNVSALVQTNAVPLFALGVGSDVRIGQSAVQAELRWYSPNRGTYFNAVDYISVGRQGALGIVISGRVNFGGAP